MCLPKCKLKATICHLKTYNRTYLYLFPSRCGHIADWFCWHKGKRCYCIRSTYFPFAEKAFVCSSLMCNLKNHNWGHIICLAEQPDTCLQCDVSVSQTPSRCDLSDSAQTVMCLAYLAIYFLYDLHTYSFTEISVVYLQALIVPLCLSLFVPLLFLRWLNGPKRKRKNSQCSVKSMTGECLMDWLSGVAPKKKALLLPEICLTSSDVPLYFREQTVSKYR